jgi:NAD(P)-dependent dehydrogenase (short-subunit alcohol dehydrogenase family)
MRRLAPTDQAREAFMSTIPLRRFAMKDEIADLALFLCSDAAQFITGTVMVCDGGQSLASVRADLIGGARTPAQ